MNRKIIVIVTLCLLFTSQTPIRRRLAEYATNPDRTVTVTEMCAEFPSREDITSDAKDKQRQQCNAALDKAFTPNGVDLYNSLMAGSQTESEEQTSSTNYLGMVQGAGQQVLADYPTLPQQFGIFVGTFMVFMVLMGLFMPICCGCCAKGCCCCFAKKDQPYSKAQLLFPAILLLGSLAAVAVSSIIGVSQAANIETTLKASGCSVAIILDDFLNGNATENSDGFFAGLKETTIQLGQIEDNIVQITSELNALQGSATFGPAYTAAKTNLDLIPTNTAGGSMGPFSYVGAFNIIDGSGQTVNSDFPVTLGSTSGGGSGYIHATDLVLDETKAQIDDALAQAATVQNDLATGGFSDGIADANSIIEDVEGIVEEMDKNYYENYITVFPILEKITLGTKAFYAGLIALSSLLIIATILAAICSRYKCRYLMYLMCLLLVLVGILSLIIASFMSIIVPMLYFGCDFLQTAFSSKEGFDSTIGSNLGEDITNFMTVCLPGQSGNLLDSEFFGDLTDSMNDFKDLFNDLYDYDSSEANAAIDQAWNANYNYIKDCHSGAVLDFTDSTNNNQQYIEKIADPTTNYPNCANAQFLADRWVPTITTPNQIPCELGSSANQATDAQCPPGDFTGGSNLCNQCMDSYLILTQHELGGGTILADLGSRYNTGGEHAECGTFVTELSAVYDNYYKIKSTIYPDVQTRADTADTSIQNYKSEITTMGADFTTCLTNLQLLIDDVIDPEYGLINGFNCAVFGEDILLIISTGCDHLFVTTYSMRMTLGIAGVGAFFAMCFTVCAGVRIYLHEKAVSEAGNEKLQNQMEKTQEDLLQKQNSYSPKRPQNARKAPRNKNANVVNNWVEPKKKRQPTSRNQGMSYFA